MRTLTDEDKKSIKKIVDPVPTDWQMLECNSFLPCFLDTKTEATCLWMEHADRWPETCESEYIDELILGRKEFQGEYL